MSTLIISGPPPVALLVIQKLIGRTVFFSLAIADPIVILINRDVKEAASDMRQQMSLRPRSESIGRQSSLATVVTSDNGGVQGKSSSYFG